MGRFSGGMNQFLSSLATYLSVRDVWHHALVHVMVISETVVKYTFQKFESF